MLEEKGTEISKKMPFPEKRVPAAAAAEGSEVQGFLRLTNSRSAEELLLSRKRRARKGEKEKEKRK